VTGIADPTGKAPGPARTDWVGDARSYVVAWGLPTAALAASFLIDPPARAYIWAAALAWMGVACLANAARCGRIHCYLTGPFFLAMAGAGVLHGLGIVGLGPDGWTWLAAAVAGGGGALWWGSERLFGKFARRP